MQKCTDFIIQTVNIVLTGLEILSYLGLKSWETES